MPGGPRVSSIQLFITAVVVCSTTAQEQWQDYAVNALQTVERLAGELGVADRLHLWPDKSLGNVGVANRMSKPKEHLRWLRKWWGRITEWPGFRA